MNLYWPYFSKTPLKKMLVWVAVNRCTMLTGVALFSWKADVRTALENVSLKTEHTAVKGGALRSDNHITLAG